MHLHSVLLRFSDSFYLTRILNYISHSCKSLSGNGTRFEFSAQYWSRNPIECRMVALSRTWPLPPWSGSDSLSSSHQVRRYMAQHLSYQELKTFSQPENAVGALSVGLFLLHFELISGLVCRICIYIYIYIYITDFQSFQFVLFRFQMMMMVTILMTKKLRKI
jgi:hypothetical protein